MKNFYKIAVLASLLLYSSHALSTQHPQTTLPFDKVVIWGHKLHSHTHSYIHYAFYKFFKHLGYETYWLDNNDNISSLDLSRSLFITAGTADQKIPVRKDSFYWLHNCNGKRYQQAFSDGRAIIFQVYTHDCKDRDLQTMEPFILYNVDHKTIYMPWATDLLPHEIDEIKKTTTLNRPDKSVYLIGSYMHGEFDNTKDWKAMARACNENGITYKQLRNLSPKESVRRIAQSYIAPAIEGTWQCKKGYIPCRIFKNISYGQFGFTNSKIVAELFEGLILYNPDAYQLFFDAQNFLKTATIEDLYTQMNFVKDHHTYINRINNLLTFASMVYKKQERQ